MSLKPKTPAPHWAPDNVKIIWDTMTANQQDQWRILNPPGKKTFSEPEGITMPDPSTIAKAPNGTFVKVYEDKPVEEWDRDMMLDGKLVPAKRIRFAILELIGKSEWYKENMSNGLVERMLGKILADSTPGWEPPEEDPLFISKKVPGEETDITIHEIRPPKNDEERKCIRKKAGITSYTIPILAKKDCLKCKGTGYYNLRSYPDHPVFKYEDTVTCECVNE
jgi:hypothetical protein